MSWIAESKTTFYCGLRVILPRRGFCKARKPPRDRRGRARNKHILPLEPVRAHDIRIFYRGNHIFLVSLSRLFGVGDFEQTSVRRALVYPSDMEFSDNHWLVFCPGRRSVERHVRAVYVAAYNVAYIIRSARGQFVLYCHKAAAQVKSLGARRLYGVSAHFKVVFQKEFFIGEQIVFCVFHLWLKVRARQEIAPVRIIAFPNFVQFRNSSVLFCQHLLHFNFGGLRRRAR